MRSLYGLTRADAFKPKDLKVLQQLWVEKGFTRKTANEFTFIAKRIFRWSVAELDLPASTYHGVCAVEGLRKGRTKAREPRRVRPVPKANIDAVRPFVARQVWAMARLQLLTGARGGELVKLRPTDIDTTRDVWTASLEEHKTSHQGRSRVIYFGPQAQDILRDFLDRPLNAYLFDPREAEQERRTQAPTHRRENQKPTPRKSSRTLGDHYTTDSYRRAIERACTKAEVPKWTPHQLRHNAATEIRREHGLEAAQVILGHASADVTQIYAEVDDSKARQVVKAMG
jgi:integrase